MSGSFGKLIRIKHTHKPHRCLICTRKMPVGVGAVSYQGMYEGDWQNWRVCLPCETILNQLQGGDEISDEDFYTWLEDNDYFECSKCGPKYPRHVERKWSDDHLSIFFKCEDCGLTWSLYLGWDEIELKRKEARP